MVQPGAGADGAHVEQRRLSVKESHLRFVQTVTTDEQAFLTHQALLTYLNQPKGSIAEDEDEESEVKGKVAGLVQFYANVIEHPEHFIPTGKMATKVRSIVRRATGEAQPKPMNKRKRAQAKRTSFKKRTRAQKRLEAKQWNEAKAKFEAEQAEMEEIRQEQEARIHGLLTQENLPRAELYELLASVGAGELVKLSKHLLAHQAEEAAADDPALD